MKESNCKVSSTWSSDKKREDAFTHRQHGNEEHGKKPQLDYIIGPEKRSDDIFICNDNKAWTTWDHYHIHARICEDSLDVPLRKRWKNNWCGWKPRTEEEKKKYMKCSEKIIK